MFPKNSIMVKLKQITIFFLILVIGLSFNSCSGNNDEQIIARNQFVEILTDLQIAEGIMATKGFSDISVPDSSKSYYNYTLKKHNISRARFDNSLKYYSKDLEELEHMYNEVIAELTAKIPKTLHPNSIYNLMDLAIAEAKKRQDPTLRFGQNGLELWDQKNQFSFPSDTSRSALKIEKKIKERCLIVLKAEFFILPKNKTKKIKMNLFVHYNDTTTDTLLKTINVKKKDWESYYLVIKTDTLKTPVKINSSVFEVDSIYNQTFVNIRGISLKQYAPAKDTTNMFIKPKPPTAKKPVKTKNPKYKVKNISEIK